MFLTKGVNIESTYWFDLPDIRKKEDDPQGRFLILWIVDKIYNEHTKHRPGYYNNTNNIIYEFFHIFDTNKDNVIEATEFQRMINIITALIERDNTAPITILD